MNTTGTHRYERTQDAGNGVMINTVWSVGYSAEIQGKRVVDVEIDSASIEYAEIRIGKTLPVAIEIKQECWQLVWQDIVRGHLTVAELIGDIAEVLRETMQARGQVTWTNWN